MNFLKLFPILFPIFASLTSQACEDIPKWGLLGDDDSVSRLCSESTNFVLVCIVDTEVVFDSTIGKLKPPFGQIIHHATVIQTYKGRLKLGDQIKIEFMTDSLPRDDKERAEFIEAANKKIKGKLKFAFLDAASDGLHSCEWVDIADHSEELGQLLTKISQK